MVEKRDVAASLFTSPTRGEVKPHSLNDIGRGSSVTAVASRVAGYAFG